MRKKYIVARGCTFCGTCLDECPAGAIAMEEYGARIDQALCRGCGACLRNCASEAIQVVEEKGPSNAGIQ